LGILWASSHLSIFLNKGWTSARFPTYLLIMTGLSFSMTWLFNLSGGSVVTAIAIHAFFNTGHHARQLRLLVKTPRGQLTVRKLTVSCLTVPHSPFRD
jgi:membrane protease YdiL (CAAX protease family)